MRSLSTMKVYSHGVMMTVKGTVGVYMGHHIKTRQATALLHTHTHTHYPPPIRTLHSYAPTAHTLTHPTTLPPSKTIAVNS